MPEVVAESTEYNPDNDVCLNAARTAVVACDSAEAHFRLHPPFDELTDEEAEALGLSKEPAALAPVPAPAEEPVEVDEPEEEEEKAVSAPVADKAVGASPSNKGKK